MSARRRDPFQSKVAPAQRSLGWWITATDLRRMWDTQRGLCALTGKPMDLATATLDHIVPRARGGSSELENLRWTTKAANHAKGDLLDDEFVGLCKQVVAHHDAQRQRQRSPAHDRRTTTGLRTT